MSASKEADIFYTKNYKYRLHLASLLEGGACVSRRREFKEAIFDSLSQLTLTAPPKEEPWASG